MASPITSEEKQKLLQMSEVSLWINHYDDIFSDFDHRAYSQRGLSDDFLAEAKKFAKERPSGALELIFLVPAAVRKLEPEHIIKKRLHEHFKKHYHQLREETSRIRNRGLLLTALGVLLIFGATLLYTLESKTFLTNLFIVLMEPSGWFMSWIGLEQLFYDIKLKGADLKFYEKMSTAEIRFRTY